MPRRVTSKTKENKHTVTLNYEIINNNDDEEEDTAPTSTTAQTATTSTTGATAVRSNLVFPEVVPQERPLRRRDPCAAVKTEMPVRHFPAIRGRGEIPEQPTVVLARQVGPKGRARARMLSIFLGFIWVVCG